MKLSTSAHSTEFPAQFERFRKLIGEKVWLQRCRAITDEIRGNALLREFLIDENRVAFELLKLSECVHRHQPFPAISTDRLTQYEATTFVVQSLNFIEQADKELAYACIRRVQSAFANPSDLRGLAFEFLAGTHLVKSGATIQLPDDGTYDWLAQRGGLEFEVECKSISNDKGRRVHQRASLTFAALVKKDLEKIIHRMRGGLIVRVSVPDRFLADYAYQKRLAALTKKAVLSAQDVNDAESIITLTQFAVSDSPLQMANVVMDDVRAFIKQKVGVTEARTIAFHKPGERAFLLIVDSQKPDILLEETLETVKDAATRQLTGKRPGIICIKFESLTDAELVSIAESRDPISALRVFTNSFLQRTDIDHVANLAFMADGPIVDRGPSGFTRGGATYFFENQKSRFALDTRLKVFNEREEKSGLA